MPRPYPGMSPPTLLLVTVTKDLSRHANLLPHHASTHLLFVTVTPPHPPYYRPLQSTQALTILTNSQEEIPWTLLDCDRYSDPARPIWIIAFAAPQHPQVGVGWRDRRQQHRGGKRQHCRM